MIMLRNLFFICFVVSSVVLNGQSIKFGDVSQAELMEELYPSDSSASAAYLYKYRNTYYLYNQSSGINLVTEIHERIKIYDTDGLDYGTKSISLYKSSSNSERLSGIKGATYHLEGGKVVATKLEKGNIYKSEFSKNRNQVKLSFPNVKEGSVLEYKYKLISPYYQSIDELVFQGDIPVKKINSSVKIIDYFKYNIRTKGFLPLIPVKNTTHNTSLRINEVLIAYNLNNVPALKAEKYVSNINNYRSAVKFEIVSLQIPGQITENFAKSWEDVVETIYDSDYFGREIDKKSYYKDDLELALEGITDEKEKAAKILDLVKTKVKWNSRGGYSSDEGVRNAYKDGAGNTGDINLMLISMLKYAGIKTKPVLLSTRNNGIPLFPTLQGFNYVVAAAVLNGEECLLDASEEYSTIDVLPTKTLNWYGRKISEDGTSEIFELSPKKASKSVTMMSVTLNDDGSAEGKFRQQFHRNYALDFRKEYNKGTKEDYLADLEEEYNGLEISDYNIKNLEKLEKPVAQTYNYYMPDVVENVSQKLIFNPLLHLVTKENPFKAKEREYPVDYAYPWENTYTVMIQVPEGYHVEHLPKPMAIMLPEDNGSFRYNISQKGNTIYLKADVKIKTAIIAPRNYTFLKEFYTKLIEKETEKVVLSKITGDGIKESTAGGR